MLLLLLTSNIDGQISIHVHKLWYFIDNRAEEISFGWGHRAIDQEWVQYCNIKSSLQPVNLCDRLQNNFDIIY